MVRRLAFLAIGGFVLVGLGASADAASTPAQRCASAKMRETAKKESAKLRCYSRAATRRTTPDPFCLVRAESKFMQGWDRIQARGGCVNTNDRAAIEAKVDAFVDDVGTELMGSPASSILGTQAAGRCASSKVRAAAKKAASKLRCHMRAIRRGLIVDGVCLSRAETRFAQAWARAESRGGCATTNDQAAIESKVDAFVTDTTTETGAGAGSSTTTTTTLSGQCGNGMINPPEQCDPPGAIQCPPGSPAGAFLGCDATCVCPATTTSTTFPPNVVCEPVVVGQPIANTYKLTGVQGPSVCHTNTPPANRFQLCTSDAQCGGGGGSCAQTPWATADGITLPFPTGIAFTFTVATADSAPTCNHQACIQCGNPNAPCPGIPGCVGNGSCAQSTCCDQPGVVSPAFQIPALSLCVRIDQAACGLGVVNTSNPQVGDNELDKRGDTSDPGADCTYGTQDDPAPKPCNTSASGAGNDQKGKITRTVGNNIFDATGIHFRLQTPLLATAWSGDNQGCPANATFDGGLELVLTQLVVQAEPTTAGARAQYTDMNGDGCALAGAGFSGAGPVVVGQPAAAAMPYDASANARMVAAAPVLSGGAPLFDLGFVAVLPVSAPAVQPTESCTCSPVAGCPE